MGFVIPVKLNCKFNLKLITTLVGAVDYDFNRNILICFSVLLSCKWFSEPDFYDSIYAPGTLNAFHLDQVSVN